MRLCVPHTRPAATTCRLSERAINGACLATLAAQVLLLLFGAYFAMQLLIAVLSSKFAQIQAAVSQQASTPAHPSAPSSPFRSAHPPPTQKNRLRVSPRARVQSPPPKKKRRKRKPLKRMDTEELDDRLAMEAGEPQDPAALDAEGRALPPPTYDLTGKPGPSAGVAAKARYQLAHARRRARNAWRAFHARFLMPTKRRDMGPLRRACYNVCYQPWFGHAATCMIVANTLVFAMTYAGEPEAYAAALELVNTGALQLPSLWPRGARGSSASLTQAWLLSCLLERQA